MNIAKAIVMRARLNKKVDDIFSESTHIGLEGFTRDKKLPDGTDSPEVVLNCTGKNLDTSLEEAYLNLRMSCELDEVIQKANITSGAANLVIKIREAKRKLKLFEALATFQSSSPLVEKVWDENALDTRVDPPVRGQYIIIEKKPVSNKDFADEGRLLQEQIDSMEDRLGTINATYNIDNLMNKELKEFLSIK